MAFAKQVVEAELAEFRGICKRTALGGSAGRFRPEFASPNANYWYAFLKPGVQVLALHGLMSAMVTWFLTCLFVSSFLFVSVPRSV